MSKDRPLIAVVDDEQSVRRAVQRLLRSVGNEVDAYSSGQEFLESLRTKIPACVVLDLHMPIMTGFDVLVSMKEMGSTLPVVIMTGYDTPDARERVMAAGAAVYLCKPIHDKELLDAITEVMGH